MVKRKKIILVVAILIIIITSISATGYLYMRKKIYTPVEPKLEVTPEVKEEIKYHEEKGITNILLIGTDGRTLDEASRSDSIIIATIDGSNQKLKFTSIMRDTYVKIPGYSDQKINAAYALGGAELLMKTIKENFGVSIDKYIVVNFWGFEDIVDSMGGLDIDVKDYEISEINKYIGEVREDKSPPIERPGLQNLDGQQALAYSRIRKVGNGSYERTERQRKVLTLLASKAREISPLKYPSVVNALLGCVKTNIEPAKLFDYGYTFYKFDSPIYDQLQIPINELSEGGEFLDKGWVLLIDKEQNGNAMMDFIFNDKKWDTVNYNKLSFKNAMNQYKSQQAQYDKINKEKEEATIPANEQNSQNNEYEEEKANLSDYKETIKTTNDEIDDF